MSNDLASIYHDFAGLAQLKHQAREDRAGTGERVAQQFESLFVRMMVKQMRQAGFGGGILDSDRTRFYQDMYDQQLSLHLTQQGGMGLGQLLRRQLGAETASPQTALGGLDPYWRNPVASAGRAFATAPVSAAPADEASGASKQLSAASAVRRQWPMASAAAASDAEVAAASPRRSAPDTPQAFVQRLWSAAEAAAGELGVPVEALLAQAALETGWGNHVLTAADGRSSHNLFGIKADQRWQGGQVRRETLEFEAGVTVRKRECFRTYDSFEQSFQDYVALLKGSPRYAEALANAADPDSYFRALQDAGYATDPAYAEKILRVMQGPQMQAAVATFKAAT
jgi:flagellar protein FlgJ